MADPYDPRYSLTSILIDLNRYLFVYAQTYSNVSEQTFGILAMILPALAFFAKPMSCSLADAKGIHRKFLIGSLSVYGISFGSCAILPFMPFIDSTTDGEKSLNVIAWIIICILFCGGYLASCCICCMNDALASNYARKNNLNYGNMRAWANLGWASGALTMMLIDYYTDKSNPFLPPRVPGCLLLIISISIDVALLTFWPYAEDFEMFHDGTTVEQRKLSIVGPNTLALMAQKKSRGSISKDILQNIKAGRSKSVGNIPRTTGSIGPLAQQGENLSHATTLNQPEPEKEYSNFQCQMILIKMIAAKHKSFLRYIGLFTIFGMVQGIVWNFQTPYLKNNFPEQFERVSAISMIVQSVGEGSINLVASHLLRLFGSNANMSLALVSIGLRCYFYCNLLPAIGTSWIFIPELLQGPSLGLYWILIVDVGSNYALMVPDFMPELKRRGIVRDRQHEEELNGCLRASTIGAMSSSMEGLGVAIGSFVGGIVAGSKGLGYDWMWNGSAALTIWIGLMNIGWDVGNKLVFNKNKKQRRENNIALPTLPSIVVEGSNAKL